MAVVDRVEVEAEDFVFREFLFEATRQDQFANLARETSFGRQNEVLHDLLRDRARALDAARRKHEEKAADIQQQLEVLEESARDEEARWEKEKARLEVALRRARG